MKEINYTKLMLISAIIVIMFISGFVSGGSFMYGLSSYEIDELETQIKNIQSGENIVEVKNISYFSQ